MHQSSCLQAAEIDPAGDAGWPIQGLNFGYGDLHVRLPPTWEALQAIRSDPPVGICHGPGVIEPQLTLFWTDSGEGHHGRFVMGTPGMEG